jgi:predicted secreted protein
MERPVATRVALLCGAMAALAVACAARDAAFGERRRVLTRADAASATALARDELLTIELEARPSAGYTWTVVAVDETVLSLAGREHVSAPILGGNDLERLLFKGVGPGVTRLSLAYRRPWAAAQPGDPTYDVEVAVSGAYTGSYVPPALPARAAYVADGTLAPSFNYCDPGDGSFSGCTAVKDQGSCGGCWAFATAGVFENILAHANPSVRYDLSEQYLISCNTDGYGCEVGGEVAFDYYVDAFKRPPESAAGAVYTPDFGFRERDVSCGSTAHPHHEKLTAYRRLGRSPSKVDAIKQAMVADGPIWVGVCADDAFSAWRPRSAKDFFRGTCTDLNHAVVLVGWNDNGGDGYWLMRNSWGSAWGDRGHMRIAFGTAGIEDEAYAVTYQGAKPANVPPAANPGPAQTVKAGATVTLDGSGSRDSDGTIARYAWAQTGGTPAVTLADPAAARASFVAPAVSGTAALEFTLTVADDRGATASAKVAVTVTGNTAPVADAGAAQAVAAGASVTLDGSASRDPDGTITRWAWTQTGGTAVQLAGASTARPTFVAPGVTAATTLSFSLAVTDDAGATGTDAVTVSVARGPGSATPGGEGASGGQGTPGDQGSAGGRSSSSADLTLRQGCASFGASPVDAGAAALGLALALARRRHRQGRR